MSAYTFTGIDVSKDKFDVALLTDNKPMHQIFNNTQKGYESFLKWLNINSKTPWICMEATGHYGEALADFLVMHNFRVSVVNPFQIKSFIKATLARIKMTRLTPSS